MSSNATIFQIKFSYDCSTQRLGMVGTSIPINRKMIKNGTAWSDLIALSLPEVTIGTFTLEDTFFTKSFKSDKRLASSRNYIQQKIKEETKQTK